MPVFEFKCPKCGKKFDILWREKGVLDSYKCPDCGALSPRVMSLCNFQFSPYLKELGEGNMLSY